MRNKGKVKKIFVLILASILIFSLISCENPIGGGGTDGGDGNNNPAVKSKTFYSSFDTVSTVYDYSGMAAGDFSELVSAIEDDLLYYHKLYDIYNTYEGVTNIKDINDSAGGEFLTVSEDIIDLLLFAKEMYNETSGAINVCMGSVLKIWHNYREAGVAIPTEGELSLAAEHTDINILEIDKENNRVRLTDPLASLDVGAVAKGYATEKVAERLISLGYSGIVLDIGGNLRIVGTKPSLKPFTVGIKSPHHADLGYIKTMEVMTGSVVTSGVYERYYTVGGKNYHHIIDNETLFPSEKYLSVSVVITFSAHADALSTAFFNMEIDEIRDFVYARGYLAVILVDKNGEVIEIW